MIEFLLEQIFSLVADVSFEKFKNWKKQWNRQRIMLITAKHYFGADIFKQEFREVTAIIDDDMILSIPSNEISPSMDALELAKTITPIFEQMIICDDENVKNQIIKSIAIQYISKSKLTLNLFELLENQKANTEQIVSKIDSVGRKILLLSDSELRKQALKEKAIQCGVGNKISHLMYIASVGFLHIVTKRPPQTSNFHSSSEQILLLIDLVKGQVKNNFPSIDEEFLHKPITSISINPNGDFRPLEHSYTSMEYFASYRFQIHREIDDMMKYTSLLSDDLLISMIELGDIVNSSILSTAVDCGAISMIMNSTPVDTEGFVLAIKDYFHRLGMHIISMKHFLR